MASSLQVPGQKRKSAFDKTAQSSSSRKRQKNHDARSIAVQQAAPSLSANGELNVVAFIKAREFEIKALEKSMQKSRKALVTRAFQQVPRHMRRRTASHNAKKVPKRLRRRAEREMKDDNTPTVTKRTRTPSRKLRLRLDTARTLRKLNQTAKTVRQRKREAQANAKRPDPDTHFSLTRVPGPKKNKLAEPPKATAKYKRRQVNKTWLPTHLWHTKRAHMTQPTEPLWRMAIPLSPTEKSYRPSHRAAGSQGCIAWDTSYMSTVACWGTEGALESMFKALNFSPQGLTPSLQRRWKSGTRFAEGWIFERDNEKRPIAPVTVIWASRRETDVPVADRPNATDQMEIDSGGQQKGSTKQRPAKRKPKLDHQVLIRIHPSAFHQFWQELLKVAKMQKPQLLVEDLRFEIGSIEIQGPGSTESLLGVLRPFAQGSGTEDPVASLWTSLAGLSNPGILPHNALLAFDIVDPRFNHPPKQTKLSSDPDSSNLNMTLLSWPVDEALSPSCLLCHNTRWQVSNALPSQKAINRRRALAAPGQSLTPTAKDPRIPVLLLASRTQECSISRGGNSQGTWTVLLPWSCVDSVWRSLMYYPLSSGGTPRFGGLKEKQQIAFEQRVPWFPGDFPGAEAGKAWERTESERRFDSWIRRPPKTRIHWDKVDLGLGRYGEVGRGWTCDWEHLFDSAIKVPISESIQAPELTKDGPNLKKPDSQPTLTQRQRKAAKAQTVPEPAKEDAARRRNTSSPESDAEPLETPAVATETKYSQLGSALSLLVLRKPSSTKLPADPVLMTVRITLLDKGTPSPAARIYRLPSLPKAASNPAEPAAQDTSQKTSQETELQGWSSAPPPGQNTPATGTTDTSTSSSLAPIRRLRTRWLALDPQSDSGPATSKVKTNRFGVPRRQNAYPRESLAKINVLPKGAPQEIIEKYGPNSAFGRGDGEVPKDPPAKGSASGKDSKAKEKTTDTRRPKGTESDPAGESESGHAKHDDAAAVIDLPSGNLVDTPSQWDTHPPCPDEHDLIGFVTSGGYNLAEGRGTAVGSLWAQRLVEGWEAEREEKEQSRREQDSLSKESPEAQQERQKRLCIVRNAGESVARLGIWEICA